MVKILSTLQDGFVGGIVGTLGKGMAKGINFGAKTFGVGGNGGEAEEVKKAKPIYEPPPEKTLKAVEQPKNTVLDQNGQQELAVKAGTSVDAKNDWNEKYQIDIDDKKPDDNEIMTIGKYRALMEKTKKDLMDSFPLLDRVYHQQHQEAVLEVLTDRVINEGPPI